MTTEQKLLLGCLGALSPIIANLLVVDWDLLLANAQLLTFISYALRVAILCLVACIVIYLNSDEEKPIKIFQLGMAAPALFTGIVNGVSLSHNVASQRVGFDVPGIISSAVAQPSTNAVSMAQPQPEDCLAHDTTPGQEVLKGFFGVLPDNRWFVSTSSNLQLRSAVDEVSEINSRFAGRFKAKICAPLGGDDKYYRVIIGQNLTREAASKLRDDALAAGLSRTTWLWSPVGAK